MLGTKRRPIPPASPATVAEDVLPARLSTKTDPNHPGLLVDRRRLSELEDEQASIDRRYRDAIGSGDEAVAVAAERRRAELPAVIGATRARIARAEQAIRARSAERHRLWQARMQAHWLSAFEARCDVLAAALAAADELADLARRHTEAGHPLSDDPLRLIAEYVRVGGSSAVRRALDELAVEIEGLERRLEGAGS